MSAKSGLPTSPRELLQLGLICVIGFAIALVPSPAATPQAMMAMGVVFATVAIWAASALPALWAGVAFFATALALQLAPPVPLLSGFWSNAAALVLGGLVIGGAAERTGLGRWIARLMLGPFMGSYGRLIFGILIGTGTLSFLVPTTMGRLAITIPIVTAAAREAGYAPASAGYIGAILTTVAGNYLTSYGILPANLTNVILMGAIEAQGGQTLNYGAYLLLALPVLGFLKGLTFWACIMVFCRAPQPRAIDPGEAVALGAPARRLAIIVAITVLLWATDFLHHIKPGWIALAAAGVCLLPWVGLATPKDVFDRNKFASIVSLAAVLGVATVLSRSGSGALIAAKLQEILPASGHSPAYGFAVIAVMTALVAIIATVVGSIAIVTPTLPSISQATGLSPEAAMIAELVGLQSLPFPYEAVPVMVGLVMGKVAARSVLRVTVPVAVLGMLVILPAQIAWLRLLGVMP